MIKQAPKKQFFGIYGSNGNNEVLYCPGIGSLNSFVHMDGSSVFRFAVDAIYKCVIQLLEKADLSLEEIDYVVCHQANERIISHVRKKLNAPEKKFFINLYEYGNTSAASIPIALDEMMQDGMIKNGAKIICVGFGGGLTWGSVLLEF